MARHYGSSSCKIEGAFLVTHLLYFSPGWKILDILKLQEHNPIHELPLVYLRDAHRYDRKRQFKFTPKQRIALVR